MHFHFSIQKNQCRNEAHRRQGFFSVQKNVVFLTGDRHRGGIYKMKTKNENMIFDITSSPINSSTYPGEEDGIYRLGNTYTETNFGLVSINLISKSTSLELKDMFGNSVISEKLLH